MKKIIILGSTGSIGVSALDVIGKNPERFQVSALAAGKNINLLKKQIEKFHPKMVAVADKEDAFLLKQSLKLPKRTKVLYGEEGVKEVASFPSAEMVLSAISGSAGLRPTLAAIDAGHDIALANKETMVLAGEIVNKKAKAKKVQIIPVDSEHSAIFQCLEGQQRDHLRRIILTASGGPFLNFTGEQLKKVTLAQTLRHPKWKMGRKITIDSASMMNKGLEIIEAKWLFHTDIRSIDVLIHPQSIIHSMVEFVDGAILSQMGVPDMRIPIAYALTYPERIQNDIKPLDLAKTERLEFCKPDAKRFPCLKIACEAGICGGTAPAVLNAADEVAVSAFMRRKIRFVDIPKVIEKALDAHAVVHNPSIDDVFMADFWARRETEKTIERMVS